MQNDRSAEREFHSYGTLSTNYANVSRSTSEMSVFQLPEHFQRHDIVKNIVKFLLTRVVPVVHNLHEQLLGQWTATSDLIHQRYFQQDLSEYL